jgi:hypothetical protein
MKCFFSMLMILPLALWSLASVRSSNDNITGQKTDQIPLTGQSIKSALPSMTEYDYVDSSPVQKPGDSIENNHNEEFSLRQYITPEDPAILALADYVSGSKDAYKMAVQWIYVTDEKLYQAPDIWLTPHEFLTDTPHYLSNPLQGEAVSDCEEKANTLASLIRAEGVRPEEVRVVLGEVIFSEIKTGHAWVELLINGNWLALDPCWGPYWDDKAGNLVSRQGVSFDYYASHTYPVLQVWTYYNDIYYLDPRDGSGNAPASWYARIPVI